MAIKYRSKVDYAAIIAGNREGFALGIDAELYIRQEAIERTFEPPRIGTQGNSESAISASIDISAGSDNQIGIAVDGGSVIQVVLVQAGLTTGLLIAAELETKINAALAAAGQDGRVWVDFDGGAPDQYTVYSQTTGLLSSVVITDGSLNNVADDLNLGVGNAGTEVVGTDDQDFLQYTTGGINFSQPVESNTHRSGRDHVGVIKQKKVVEMTIDTYLNMSGSAGDSIDTALRVLLKSAHGKETVTPGLSIKYERGIPNFTFSIAKVGTIFGEYYDGCYVKDNNITAPGDAPVTMNFSGGGSDASIAGVGQVNGAVVASASVVLDGGNFPAIERYTEGARVMAIAADGRTIVAGADGTLSVVSATIGTDTLVLSTTIDVEDNGFIVPWNPGAVQKTGRDAIFTDLAGTFKMKASGTATCATNISIDFVNDHVDINNCFGLDANAGFVPGSRMTATQTATFDLSNENMGDLVQARKFGGFVPELIIGEVATRHLKITSPKWITSVPPIDVPESGVVPVEFSGIFYQSTAGAQDSYVLEFL